MEGSGSNLWTRSIVKSLCNNGKTVHLVCQENHPEIYDFISESFSYSQNGSVETILKRKVPYKGKCILHKPKLGDTLPVYVWDKYEEFSNVVPMIELSDEVIEDYLNRNTQVVRKVINDFDITAIHANHAVLMSVVAQRVSVTTSVPFAVMPHGSAIEFAVKKDPRFLKMATEAFTHAKRIFVVGDEMHNRVKTIFSTVSNIENKMIKLNLGVDTKLFKPIPSDLRTKNIENLCKRLENMPRGKKSEQSQALKEGLFSNMQKEELQQQITSTSSYDTKCPDSDIESKLNQINWKEDKIILFVGRIISSKGLQSVIAALPLILEQNPSAKLLVVGHGPLREPLEILLQAFKQGENDFVKKIIMWGESLEQTGKNPFSEIIDFYDQLKKQNKLDEYFEKAQKYIDSNTVVFTGYLTHEELRYLFPCCDVAIFPSKVIEAGPLVFLEALASGCFPLGTYFGGMAASIDFVATKLLSQDTKLMKISAARNQMVADIVEKTSQSLVMRDKHKTTLHNIATEFFDWNSVSKKLWLELNSMVN